MTKKAFTLMEVLAVLITIPVVLLLGNRIFVAVVRDVPKDARLLQQNALVLDMTRRIAEDMDRAEGLPQSTGTFSSDPQTLLIQLPEAVACYQQSGETVTRTVIGREEAPDTWEVPDATIAWQRWERGDRAYAIELRTHLTKRLGEQIMERFANSHVYFIDAMGKAEQSQ